MRYPSLRLDPETEEQLRQDARRMAQEAWHDVQVLEAQLDVQHRLKLIMTPGAVLKSSKV